MPRRRFSLTLVALGGIVSMMAARADSAFDPSSGFAEVGGYGNTHEVTAGLTWEWNRHWESGAGDLTGYWETSLSEWSYRTGNDRRSATLAKIGLVPVFRYRLSESVDAYFVEAGVGVTLTTSIYQTQRKHFSTNFNFGDHLAIGKSFGASGQHELALRAEHFSNGGIKEPNPGVNFIELRYAYKFR